MADPAQQAGDSALGPLLDRQLAALQRVLELLDVERAALLARDADELERVTAAKAAALSRADEIERGRRTLAPTLSDMERFARDPQISGRWERLLDLTRQCRERNDANGQLIRRQQSRVESALGLLRGGNAAGDKDLYGPDGETRRGTGRKPLASA